MNEDSGSDLLNNLQIPRKRAAPSLNRVWIFLTNDNFSESFEWLHICVVLMQDIQQFNRNKAVDENRLQYVAGGGDFVPEVNFPFRNCISYEWEAKVLHKNRNIWDSSDTESNVFLKCHQRIFAYILHMVGYHNALLALCLSHEAYLSFPCCF